MPRHITTLQIEFDVHKRIIGIRDHVSMELRFNERSLGLGAMLGLLVDHWQQHPPSPEWLHEQAQLYPKRGRPSRAVNGTVIGNPISKKAILGHELFKKKIEGSTYEMFYCKRCNMQFNTWDSKTPPARCPGDGVTFSIYTPKRWTKNELLAEGFEASEVEWADS